MKNILYILIILLTSSCGLVKNTFSEKKSLTCPIIEDNAINDWNNLTGKWYGKCKLKNNTIQEWLADRNNDGHYVIEFKTINEDGDNFKQIEKGEWGISGNVYFTIFKSYIINNYEETVDSTDAYARDTYKVFKLNNKIFKYRHIRTGENFKAEKVDSSFTLQ